MRTSFWRDESGQSLVFAAVTFFAVVVVALLVVGVAETTSAQIELQNAADTAAYAGSQVLADSVAQIAWLNEGMAHVYYRGMRYGVDTAALGTLASFKEHEPYYGTAGSWADLEGKDEWQMRNLFAAPDSVVGLSDVEDRYQEAYATADEWIPRAEAWLLRLSRVQRGVAVLASEAVKCQVAYTALQNGAERFAYYPGFILIPREARKRDCSLEKVPDGWHIYSDADGYDFTARHVVKFEPGEHGWSAASPDGVHDAWSIDLTQTDRPAIHMEVNAYYPSDTSGTNWQEFPARYEVYTTIGGELHTDLIFVIDRNHIIHYQDGERTELTVEPGPDGNEYTIDGARVRQTPEGTLEVWEDANGDGVVDEDEWVAMPETTTVDGVEIPIDYQFQTSIQPIYPVVVRVRQATVTLRDPVRIDFHTPIGWVRVRDDDSGGFATINGLNTRNTSEKWERIHSHGHDYEQRDDRAYHRLKEVDPDLEWLYERVLLGSYMEDMPMRDFALHAIMDHDPYFDAHASGSDRFVFPTRDDADYRDGDPDTRWHNVPPWARPARVAEALEEALDVGVTRYDVDYGGWFDIAQGRPRTYNGRYTMYSQSRPCWFCDGDGGSRYDTEGGSTVRDLDRNSLSHGETFERPAGFWHEEWEDAATRAERIAALNEMAWDHGFPRHLEVAVDIHADKPGHIQVLCPVCARRYVYEHLQEWVQGPPFELDDYLGNLSGYRSFVRKYLCHALGRHDPGRPASPWNRTLTPQDRMSIQPAQTYNADHWQPPLRLTAEFFRKGITVGTWKTTVSSMVFDTLGGRETTAESPEGRAGIHNPFPTAEERDPLLRPPGAWSGTGGEQRSRWFWGHFGMATARLVFWNDVDYPAPTRDVTFDGAGFEMPPPPWLADLEPEEIDPLGRAVNWNRQSWLRGPMNLFDPDWDARLVSARLALDLRDVYLAEDYEDDEVPDTSLSFLYDELGKEEWPDNIVDLHRRRGHYRYGSRNPEWTVMHSWRHMAAPPMQEGRQGNAVNWDAEEIEDVVRH